MELGKNRGEGSEKEHKKEVKELKSGEGCEVFSSNVNV